MWWIRTTEGVADGFTDLSPGPTDGVRHMSGSGGIDERASVPGYGTTSHLPRYQEKQQTVTAAWAGWRPCCPVCNIQPIAH